MNSQGVTQLVPTEQVERLIHFARGEKVLLDADLAVLYGVTTGNLNKAVQRNQQRFPPDIMFQLSDEETTTLIFQSGRSKQRGGRRHNPYAFTEQGVAMLSMMTPPAKPPREIGFHTIGKEATDGRTTKSKRK